MTHYRFQSSGETVILRIDTGKDLLESLRQFMKEEGIHNAAIISGIGSASTYHYHVVASSEIPPEEAFPKGKRAVDISHIQGYVMDGRVHGHITFSDQQVSFGGHLEPGVTVLTFAIITLQILPDSLEISPWDSLDFATGKHD